MTIYLEQGKEPCVSIFDGVSAPVKVSPLRSISYQTQRTPTASSSFAFPHTSHSHIWMLFLVFFEPFRSENIIICPRSLPSPCSVSNRHQLVRRMVRFSTRCIFFYYSNPQMFDEIAKHDWSSICVICPVTNKQLFLFLVLFCFHFCQRLRHN